MTVGGEIVIGLLAAAIILLVVITLAKSVRVVPQQQMNVVERLGKYQRTLKPVLWADGARNQPVAGSEVLRNDGAWYAGILRQLRDNPGCVGAHLCGAYLRNKARHRGLRDALEIPDTENIELITKANVEMAAWAQSAAR